MRIILAAEGRDVKVSAVSGRYKAQLNVAGFRRLVEER